MSETYTYESEPPAKNKVIPWLIVLLVLVGLCCLTCLCVFFGLTLLGPSVGNVFSTIIVDI